MLLQSVRQDFLVLESHVHLEFEVLELVLNRAHIECLFEMRAERANFDLGIYKKSFKF